MECLVTQGHEVVAEAENGEQALQLIADCRPDVVLLDLQMPRMNGWEFLRAVRDSGKAFPPIIVISTMDVVDTSLPVFAAMRKTSLDLDELLAAIGAACAKERG